MLILQPACVNPQYFSSFVCDIFIATARAPILESVKSIFLWPMILAWLSSSGRASLQSTVCSIPGSEVRAAASSGSSGMRGIGRQLILFRTLFSLLIWWNGRQWVLLVFKRDGNFDKRSCTLRASASALSLQVRSIWNWISSTPISLKSWLEARNESRRPQEKFHFRHNQQINPSRDKKRHILYL